MLKPQANEEQEVIHKTNSKENVSPTPISAKLTQIPLKGTESHSTHKAKIKDNGLGSRKASSNRNESSSSIITSSYLKHPSTGSSTKSHSSDYGEPASARLDQSTPKQGLDQPPALLSNLEKLMTDIVKQNVELIRQNENITKQNKELKELITEELIEKNGSEANLSELFQPLKGFSLETVEQFDELNTNQKLRKNLYNHLKTRGATRLREFIHNSLAASMTDKLVSQFKWLGDPTSPKFGNTRVTNVLYGILISVKVVSEKIYLW